MLKEHVLTVGSLTFALAIAVVGLLVPTASASASAGSSGTQYVQKSGTFTVCICGGSECYPCANLIPIN